jgi:restriction endonuclease S subunit
MAAIGSTIVALTAQQAESSYVRHFIASQFQMLNNNTRGTGIPHVDPEVFWNLEVPLAPLAEQRRIVANLETLLGRVDASQQRLAKIPVLLKRFRQTVLAAACSGRLTADWREKRAADDVESVEDFPEGWRSAPLSEFLESSFYGPHFGKEIYASEGVPTIRTTDMGFDGSIVLTDAPRIRLLREELEKYRLRHGDLVVTRTGATIGKCAVYDESRGAAIPGAYLIRFRFKQDLVAPKYVLRFFMSPAGQSLLIGGSNAVAQPNVNATTISQFVIPVPPLPEQQEIVRRVEGLFALADQLEARLAQGARASGEAHALPPRPRLRQQTRPPRPHRRTGRKVVGAKHGQPKWLCENNEKLWRADESRKPWSIR